MATRTATGLRRLTIVAATAGLIIVTLGHGGAYAAHKHSPTPTSTRTATATPTPTPASCVIITAPAPKAAVSGVVAISTSDVCAGNWFESLYVDGAHVGDFVTGQVVLTSTAYAHGAHTIAVTSQSMNPGSAVLGSASEVLNLQNTTSTETSTWTPSATPPPTGAPTPSSSPTPTSTPTPGGTTYYVSPNGSDSAAGTSPAPLRTIQKAANKLQSGQTAIAAPGNHAN